ncbi:TIM-barrel domain-containing protein [Paraconexibacter sp.]|uniref:TIM-barrel domain-containing protein n=1 Tax=Paraconexibacter sp. TaxID=2949640 RepID=UPI00356493A1
MNVTVWKRTRAGGVALAALVTGLGVIVPSAPALADQTAAADAGTLRASVTADPWSVRFDGPAPQSPLDSAPGTTAGPVGALGFRTSGGWRRATRIIDQARDGDAFTATLATTDPGGRTLTVRIAPAGDGLVRLTARVAGGEVSDVQAVGGSFVAPAGEHHLGFGERANAIDQRGNEVENYVADGPYQPIEDPFIQVFVPGPGYRPRADATYFPIPWLLSSRGIGALVENDETSTFRLANDDEGAWSVAVNATEMRLLVVAGPTPAKALERFTAHVGRQPPAAAPFFFGPWWQAKGDAYANLEQLRAVGAAGSVLQTYTHYLPCGDQRGKRHRERDRNARFHAAGLAVTTYFNPMVCESYGERFDEAVKRGVLTKRADGSDYIYDYQGSDRFKVGQVDFTHPDGPAFYGDLLEEAVEDGHDGWMEDFGEYTPLDAVAHDGGTGEAGHNAYVRQYHAAARLYARTRTKRPLARFNRSGWTGSAKESQIVWGGDPTTDWGFDGLRSTVQSGVSMGLSGVSLWGSDIGGFFALSAPQTTPELLARWIEVGFASGVMRTQANGFDLQSRKRAQIFDKDTLPIWRRYARLRTQLYPYLASAQRDYDRTGLPLMRHLVLAYPDDARATGREDQYLLGDDLLVAPVITKGATSRRAYLPQGDWVEWWRSVDLDDQVAPQLSKPKLLEGRTEVAVQAPLDELPLFVRAGAVLPLLDPSVETLTAYGKGATVRLADRKTRLRLLAWPRGTRTTSIGPDRRDTATSADTRRGWVLRLRQGRTRKVEVQATLSTLRDGAFTPCRILGGRTGRVPLKRKSWSYDEKTGVLRVRLTARNARLQVLRNC